MQMNAQIHEYVEKLEAAPATLDMLSQLDAGPDAFLGKAPQLLQKPIPKVVFHSERPGCRRYARVAPTKEQERCGHHYFTISLFDQ